MSKYRFKTIEEFKESGQWIVDHYKKEYPEGWNSEEKMNHYCGQDISDKCNSHIEDNKRFKYGDWKFNYNDCVLIELSQEEIEKILKEVKENNSLITKKDKTMKKAEAKVVVENPIAQKFVFMDKTINILNVGFQTQNNVILHGSGGHGKSEITLDFFKHKGITPYVITMGTGMTTDRLFGGLDIPTFETTGKIEYLVENSFMNHEYVIFEEMMDAPDFILEQLKDILSSGIFRNGTQIYHIKTKFIVCCTNRTREEFSKNMSLKALMERFPLEQNVVWDNYTEISYNKLLESKFGEGEVDPVIPYLLQEYAKNGIVISPRIAVTAYQIYDECGPEALTFIAEFSKKQSLIADAIKKFESTIKFRELSEAIIMQIEKLSSITVDSSNEADYKSKVSELNKSLTDINGLAVNDDIAHVHSQLVKAAKSAVEKFEKNLQILSIL